MSNNLSKLEELKKSKVESVLVDLRGNGGGSLSEAIVINFAIIHGA